MTSILVYIAAVGMLLWLIIAIIRSVSQLQPLKTLFLSLVLVLFSAPAFVALLLNNLLFQTQVPIEHVLNVWLYCIGCMLAFLVSYRIFRFRQSPSKNGRTTIINRWEISSQAWIGMWLLGVIGFMGTGLTPEGMRIMWQQGWLLNAGISGQNTIGFGGYLLYIAQACVVLCPLTLLWTRHFWQKILAGLLIVMGLVYSMAGGGRVIFAPYILAVMLRLFIDIRNPASRLSRLFTSISSSSIWSRLRLTLLILVGLVIISLLFNFIYFLRDYRDPAGLFEAITTAHTYNTYLSDYLRDPQNTPIGDMVWIYAFRVTYDAPSRIPIQPERILKDIMAYLVPGFIYDFGRGNTIENEIAYYYLPGTYKQATIHPSFIGISYLLFGWYGFLIFALLGFITKKLDITFRTGISPLYDLLWIGIIFIFGYWMIFALRGAITFASFRSLYAFYLWIFLWIGMRLLYKNVPTISQTSRKNLSSVKVRS